HQFAANRSCHAQKRRCGFWSDGTADHARARLGRTCEGRGAIPIEIDTPPGGEQVVSHQVDILDVDAGNQLTLELADSGAGSGLLGDEGSTDSIRCATLTADIAATLIPNIAGGVEVSPVAAGLIDDRIILAQGCSVCQWCNAAAYLACSETGVDRVDCDCPNGPCTFTCQGE